MILQLAVDDWNYQSGHIGSHSVLNLKSHCRESEAYQSFKEAHIHPVLEGHGVHITGGSQLLVVAYHDKVLASGGE
jgi:hypothetical protein